MEERAPDSPFSGRVPESWIEISTLILTHAADDVNDSDKVRDLVKDLREARATKIRDGIRREMNPHKIQMNNLGRMEINEIRTLVVPTMDTMYGLVHAKKE